MITFFSYRPGDITVSQDPGHGYGFTSELPESCGSCSEVKAFLDSSTSLQWKGNVVWCRPKSAVYHSCGNDGSGYEDLATFSSIMNMHCISNLAYQRQLKIILDILEKEAKEVMTNADFQATNKEKKRRQGGAVRQTWREEALCEAEVVTYKEACSE